MSASDNLSQQLFHGTRAKITGDIITPGPSGFAYATTDKAAAELFGKTKLPEGEVGENKVYLVEGLGKVTVSPGNFPDEMHHASDTGFKIVGEA